ncbi:MAG: hypothetical protein E7420_00545 [Ruminococcaceae bacterium]|nr:hypothetical protein [Oscillospiraceae bacterium]
MITFEKALSIAKEIKAEKFPNFKHGAAAEIKDRWAFIFSADKDTVLTPAPMFYVFKENGRVEWFSVPPMENLELINSGEYLGTIE